MTTPPIASEGDFAHRYWRTQTKAAGLTHSMTNGPDSSDFRLLADLLPTPCWIANGDGYIVWYNRRWHDYCGTTPEQLEGWGWQAVHDPAMLPVVMERWTASVATGASFEMVFPLLGADGVFRPFLTRVHPVFGDGGAVIRWLGVNTEMSAQAAAEESLRIDRDRSRDVLENMAEGFVLLDRNFRVLDINAEGMRLETRPRAAIIGLTHWEAWPGTQTSELGAFYRRVMQTGERGEIEHHYVWPDGRRAWMEVRAFPSGEGLALFYRDVTDRRLGDARLRESEEHYRNAVELNPQTVWTSPPDGQLDRVGRRWFEWTGTSGLGGTWGEAIHPDDLQRSIDAWVHSTTTGKPYDIEHRVRMRDGGHRWMHSRAYPDRDDAGAIIKWYGTTQDVQDQKDALAELARSQARFRTVAETMPGFVWTADAAGLLDYTSPNWHAYSGSSPDDSNGEGWAAYVHPDDQGNAFGRWALSVTSGEPYEVEFRLRRADGQYRWWLARARRSGDGAEATWIGTCTDLDDIIAARETLALARDDLQRAVEARTQERDRIWRLSPDLLMTATLDGRILSLNPAWADALGHDERTLLETPFLTFVHQDHQADTVAAGVLMRSGITVRNQNRVRTADGNWRWFDWVSTPVDDIFYAVGRDISDSKARDAELERTQETLRQSQKMEAVGQLTGGIAHDFNNMLAVVIGSLDLLGRRLGTADARAIRYVEAAAEGARRAATLTQRLLAFSRQQPLQPRTVDANRLVATMSDILRRALGSDVRLETVLAGGLWRTHVDPNQLENVILNLGVNARDAMPHGGRLTIETQNGHLDTLYVAEHLGVPAGQYVVIAVTDTGSGMPPEVIAKAFDPFFTTKPVGKGTGLGLSQVYGFVKQSGGHVKIYSEPGEGTTVKIYLPRIAVEDVPAGDPVTPAVVPLGYRDEVVLVVEDEPAVRQLSVDALNELGYRVLQADGAAAALQMLAAHPEIVLLFTDIVMPDVNGAKLAEEARRRRPGLKVLFTTGYTRNAVVHNGVVDQGVELIGKPFGIEELAAKVRQVIDAPV
ncbi:hybrid sensor histidine kinase/response regulator [Sphingomonas sp.]|uniref:hybrid sensor histidine kinase/response regulator n=1 Tax=Sphingomonas sp. TaxID=28214 RepID=UPI002ED7A30D